MDEALGGRDVEACRCLYGGTLMKGPGRSHLDIGRSQGGRCCGLDPIPPQEGGLGFAFDIPSQVLRATGHISQLLSALHLRNVTWSQPDVGRLEAPLRSVTP